MTEIVSEYSLRRSTAADSEFCYRLHRQTMQSLIREVFGDWNEDVQRSFHARWFDPVRIAIIQVQERDVGVLDVTRGEDIYIGRIELSPRWQGRRIGTSILRDLQEEARLSGCSVKLHVFKQNVAGNLYRRLGFAPIHEEPDRLLLCWHGH